MHTRRQDNRDQAGEEALPPVDDHSIAEVDKREQAHHFEEHEIRSKVKAAKKRYEDTLRRKFYGFQRKFRMR
jgi:hypothetical protein